MKPFGPRPRRRLLLLLCACPLWAQPARRALVIGNDSYPGNRLANARNDARGLASVLSSSGYVVTLALDVDRRQMAEDVDRYTHSLKSGDVALIYYAGHGLQVAGENYLIPVDFRVTSPADVPNQGYPLSSLLQAIIAKQTSTQVVILDACRDNPFLHTRAVGSGWATVSTSAGTYLAFGTAPGSTASDDPSDSHGLFTKALLQHFSSPLDIDQMFREVRQDVVRQSAGGQVPWTASSLIGTFHLASDLDRGHRSPARLAGSSPVTKGESAKRSLEMLPSAEGRESSRLRETALLDQALDQTRAWHLQQAVDTLQAILAFDPICSAALRLLGAVFTLLDHHKEAQESLSRAIQIDPQDGLAYSYRCLAGAQEPEAVAEHDCREAIRLQPQLSQPHLGLALILTWAGRSQEAYAEATAAAGLEPRSGDAYLLAARIATAQHWDDKASENYAKANAVLGSAIRVSP